MLHPIFAGYIGREQEEAYASFIAENNFFCILEVFGDYSHTDGEALLKEIGRQVIEKQPHSLDEFDEAIHTAIGNKDIPIDFSLATGYCNGFIFYLKTVGTGQIYIQRKSQMKLIIEGNNTASGHIIKGDLFIFSTSYFMDTMKSKEQIKKIIHSKKLPGEMVEDLTSAHREGKDSGVILFTVFDERVDEYEELSTSDTLEPSFEQPHIYQPQPSKPYLLFLRIRDLLKENKKKRIVFAAIIFIFLLLVVNAGSLFGKKQLGIQKRTADTIKQEIEAQLQTVETNSDISRSLGIIAEARQILSDFAEKEKNIDTASIKEIESIIARYEAQALKLEEKKAVEFYDLNLEEKDAKADEMYMSDKKAVLLNREGKIYILSLENKSFEKIVSGTIANARLVSSYENSVYFYKDGSGIFRSDDKEKPERIIEDDDDWGNIIDMNIYNGNIYILDESKEEIYKYLVAENGYSGKSSYIKAGGIQALKQANSLAIDSAVYVGLEDRIVKYLSGIKEDLDFQFPDSGMRLVKIYTDKDLDEVFAWDKSKGILYVFSKDGTYLKQIRSRSLSEATDFVVFESDVYLLLKAKIMRIAL
ncbi:MAG: hypothetical protein WC489_00245 [Patescibacteria group bacterium]